MCGTEAPAAATSQITALCQFVGHFANGATFPDIKSTTTDTAKLIAEPNSLLKQGTAHERD